MSRQFNPLEYQQMLLLYPAAALEYGERYIVGFRRLISDSGSLLEADDAFASLRDNITTQNPDIEFRRNYFDSV